MASGKIYTYPDNPRAFKALIAAAYSGNKVDIVPDFKFGETNRTEDFLSKFPLGKVPAFEGSDGACLFESNAIAYHVSSAALRGDSPAAQAQVVQWLSFADNEIGPAALTWLMPCFGYMQYNKQNTERAKEEMKKCMGLLNTYLSTHTFLVGERITLADIVMYCSLHTCYKMVFDAAFREPFPHLNRWFVTCGNQPQFKDVAGDVKLCEKMAQFDAKKFAEMSGKGGKEAKKEKKEKPKEAKKKEQKKEPEPEEELEPPKPKEDKDPLAKFPAGKFIMDEFKREYSNMDTETVAIPFFWKNFDKENYSIWHCTYKYNDELKKIFMTCNLVAGMFQRIEKLHKYAFGSMLILGKDDDNRIEGIWFWRSHELIFDLNENWNIDAPSYDWKKLDPDTEETKAMVHKFFMHEGDFSKPFNQGKIFK